MSSIEVDTKVSEDARISSSNTDSSDLIQHNRILTALWSCWIGDALAMPVHWIYDHATQIEQYGAVIRRYLAPLEPHPNSWEYFSLITAVHEQREWPFRIFHNHIDLFDTPGTHYHHAMKPGENTLQMRVQEQLMHTIFETNQARTKTGSGAAEKVNDGLPYDFDDYAQRFIRFMTTPGMHPDTYIGGAFQHFFRQLAADPDRNPRGKGYDDPCVAGLVLPLPLMLLAARSSNRNAEKRAERNAIIRQHLFLTHASELLYGLAVDVADLVSDLLCRQEAPIVDDAGSADLNLGQPVAASILRRALAKMMAANVNSTHDANATCGLPMKKNNTSIKKKTNDPIQTEADRDATSSSGPVVVSHGTTRASDSVATPSIISAAPVVSSSVITSSGPMASGPGVVIQPPPLQDPVYLAWRAKELLTSPSKRQHTIDQLLQLDDRTAFDAMFSVRCYAERSLPGAVFLALRSCMPPTGPGTTTATLSYADSIRTDGPIMASLLANAQLGGDSCHRAQVLGVLLGCIHARDTPPPAPAAAAAPTDVGPAMVSATEMDDHSNTMPATDLLPAYWQKGLRTGENDQMRELFKRFAAICIHR